MGAGTLNLPPEMVTALVAALLAEPRFLMCVIQGTEQAIPFHHLLQVDFVLRCISVFALI
jgi:hypothetical protein